MIRSEYITIAELNEILGTSYTEDNKRDIYEASELIDYHTRGSSERYNTESAPKSLKLATAYQVEYNLNNPGLDDEWSSGTLSVSTGKTSVSSSTGETGSAEYKKVSPKAHRELKKGGLINRKLL